MRFFALATFLLATTPAFACDRASAGDLVKAAIAQGLLADETLRVLKMGTVETEEKMGERIYAVHAVFELEKFGRKSSENSVVFRFDSQCQVIGSSGARLQKVTF